MIVTFKRATLVIKYMLYAARVIAINTLSDGVETFSWDRDISQDTGITTQYNHT